jgi:microcystin-dependent protein
MQIKVYAVDVRFPVLLRRALVVGGILAAVLLGTVHYLHADVAVPNAFVDGDPLSAKKMNDNFDALKAGINTLAASLATLQASASADSVPLGTVVAFAGSTPPAGWLLCDGSTVSRTQYAALFAAVGVTYCIGDAVTTFKLPDLRGRVVVAVGAGGGLSSRVVGRTFGEEQHTLSEQEMPVHHHTGTTEAANKLGPILTEYSGTGGGPRGFSYSGVSGGGADIQNHTHDFTSATSGGGAAHNNMPPALVLNYVVKT